jgi:hypothetical protein
MRHHRKALRKSSRLNRIRLTNVAFTTKIGNTPIVTTYRMKKYNNSLVSLVFR